MKYCLLASVFAGAALCMEQASLARAVAKEDAADRLHVAAVRHVQAFDAGWLKWKAGQDARIKQKVEDAKVSDDAACGMAALDWLSDNRVALLAGPGKADAAFRLRVARHVRYYAERQVILDWKEYEKDIEEWARVLLADADAVQEKPAK